MKPASAKAKGRNAENLWVDWLQANGWRYAERRRLTGVKDRGDIAGTPNITWEIKSHRTMHLPQWMRETEQERLNNHDPIAVLVVKPTGVGKPDDFWCVITPRVLAHLLQEAGYASH